MITIDLHGQHVKQAIRILKIHLLFGVYVPCKHLLQPLILYMLLFFLLACMSNEFYLLLIIELHAFYLVCCLHSC